jgi:hypothetical protein
MSPHVARSNYLYSSAVHSVADSMGLDGLNARHMICTAPTATVATITRVRMLCILLKRGGRVTV